MAKSNYEQIKAFRLRRKQVMVEAMGNGCQICGYDRCNKALDFHHIDGKDSKDFGFGNLAIAWTKVYEELQKCILLCKNCHVEVHAGEIEIPEKFAKISEDYADVSFVKKKEMDECSICGGEKPVSYKYCSYACSNRARAKRNNRTLA